MNDDKKKMVQTQSSNGSVMKCTNAVKAAFATGLIGAASLMAMSAQAAVTFDTVSPATFVGGDTFTENGFLMTVQDSPAGPGAAGAIINPADPFSCFTIACPVGNKTQYFAGINDGGIVFSRPDAFGFRLNSLDFAFISPVGQLIQGAVGKLNISGISQSTGGTYSASIDFPQQINGQYAFSNFALSSRFSDVVFSKLSISACVYDVDGGCYRPIENLAQFAIDNVNVSAVPEPSTWAMLAIGLVGLAATARRRRSV